MTKEEILARVIEILQETFEIEAQDISSQARLMEDLDIDSIDAVDLIVRLQGIVGKRLTPEAFKAVRTVQDVVDAVYHLVNDSAAA